MHEDERPRKVVGSAAPAAASGTGEERPEASLGSEGRLLWVGNKHVLLTKKQGRILAVLLQPPVEEPKSTETLGRLGLGPGWTRGAVRKHIARLRSKIGAAGLSMQIVTCHGYGYSLHLGIERKAR